MFIASQNVLSVVRHCNIENARDQLETDKPKSGRGKREGERGRREKNLIANAITLPCFISLREMNRVINDDIIGRNMISWERAPAASVFVDLLPACFPQGSTQAGRTNKQDHLPLRPMML